MQTKQKSNSALYSFFLLIGCFSIFIMTVSCDQSEETTKKVKTDKEFISILFSHNIHGETHPCGCRQFPLGGLPQVAGLMHKIAQDSYTFYVDSGDMLFPNSVIPAAYAKSLKFTAHNIVKAQNQIGLKLFTPGDYDFAQGSAELKKILDESKFQTLMTNAKKSTELPHSIPRFQLSINNYDLYFFGVVNSGPLNGGIKNLFDDPIAALKKEITQIKPVENRQVKIIVLSHSGLSYDQSKLAVELPMIDWIIGAHTQSFLQNSIDVAKTQIGQVLSRNHYLGEIKIELKTGKTTYKVHEVSENLDKALANNPFVQFIDTHKKDLSIIQEKEQKEQFGSFESKGPAPTYQSCFECHKKQSHFWQTTAHSLAYVTLHKNAEEKNRNCIGCHSLNFEKKNGFFTHDKIITDEKAGEVSPDYWTSFEKIFHTKKDLRELAPKMRKKLSEAWIKLDGKFKVTHNYANVQCLNCHEKANEHPFEVAPVEAKTTMKDKCLNCHTKDQSPQWYSKDSKGQPTNLNGQVFKQMLDKVSCPKGE